MGPYKRIERLIGDYIRRNYRCVVEVGVGENLVAARIIREAGISIRCTDIRPLPTEEGIPLMKDDIFSPEERLYSGADLIYAIRPGVEMVPPLIALAEKTGADLLVYHLGNEVYGTGGELIDCGVILHRYYSRRRTKSNSFFSLGDSRSPSGPKK